MLSVLCIAEQLVGCTAKGVKSANIFVTFEILTKVFSIRSDPRPSSGPDLSCWE